MEVDDNSTASEIVDESAILSDESSFYGRILAWSSGCDISLTKCRRRTRKV